MGVALWIEVPAGATSNFKCLVYVLLELTSIPGPKS